jgi:hypothetical protein
VPVSTAPDEFSYCAMAGAKHAQGKTAGEALDALTAQFPPDETSAFVVVQSLRADRYFTAEQQQRLGTLMAGWQTAQSQRQAFPPDQQRELESLIEAELSASAARTAALADAVGR